MQKDDLAGLADKPGRSPANRSLERGIEILRAFRPGSELLANGDLAERTGLSRSTVSRLTQTLVGAGMLHLEAAQRAYRLAPAVLSLAHAMRSGSNVLAIAAPKMRALAERERINVGLAARTATRWCTWSRSATRAGTRFATSSPASACRWS